MKYKHARWIVFLEKLSGFEDEVCQVFAHNFDGKMVKLGSFEMVVNEDLIVEETKLSKNGEKYFKGILFDQNLWQPFLVTNYSILDRSKGIPSGIKPELWIMITSLQKFLTCEGRYSSTFLYHLILLPLFEGGPKVNFPFFLWKILQNMLKGVKSMFKKLETSLYHHGLIKLLIVHELRKRNGSWKNFLPKYFF